MLLQHGVGIAMQAGGAYGAYGSKCDHCGRTRPGGDQPSPDCTPPPSQVTLPES